MFGKIDTESMSKLGDQTVQERCLNSELFVGYYVGLICDGIVI